MNRLLACRVCLAYDTRLYSIMDGQFCDIYEKLVEASLKTEDKRPTSVCYICFASMKKILQFRDRSQKANQILQQMISSGLEPSVTSLNMLVKDHAGISWTLKISDIARTTTTLGDVEVQVKLESVKMEMDIDGMSDQNEAEPESDQKPSSTVENSAATVWNGCINMVDVARFHVAAHEASGNASVLEEDLSAELEIVRRINPDLVWDYINKMKRTTNKDIVVLKLQAASDEEKMQYIALYSYLSSRNRLGVVKVLNTSSVKDIFIVPLPANTTVPSVLTPFDGPGLGEIKTHHLICIVIRQREQRIAPHIPKEIVPEKPSVSSLGMLDKDQAGISWTLGISNIERTTTTLGEVEVQAKIESVKSEMDIDGVSDQNEAEPESDQKPSSTVENSAAIVWNGCINIMNVARFHVAAHEASGNASGLEKDLSAELEIFGRVIPDLVWEYIKKIKRATNRDIVVLKLQAASDEEKVEYIALYSYLSSGNRLGGVKVSYKSSVKDIFIVPLPANAPVPSVLTPFDGPGLGEVKTNLLICIVIRQREKRIVPQILKEIVPEKPSVRSLDMLDKDQAGISWTPAISDIERTTTTLGEVEVQTNMETVKSKMDIDGISDQNEEPESDQKPSSTVENSAAIVWNGCINMVDVARFHVAAHEASGNASGLEEDLSAELEIVGRINPDLVWDYINKMKRTTNKDVVVLKLQAASDEEKMQYIALYSYLSSRNRLGVVKVSNTSSVKDIYVVPLPANTPVPSVLTPFDGPGLGEVKTNLLICIVIRQRALSSHLLSSSVKDKIAASLGAAPPEHRKLHNNEADKELVNIQAPLKKPKNNEEPIEKKEDKRNIPVFKKGSKKFTSTIFKETEMTTSHIVSEQQKDSACNKNDIQEIQYNDNRKEKDRPENKFKVKTNECPYCMKIFTRNIDLTRHLRIHYKGKPFKCDLCEKCFSHSGNLTTHLRAHTKEKPFKCDICEKAFAHSHLLTRHLRFHTEEKPFKCIKCEKCFSQRSYLTAHLRVHTKEKPFKCDICEKAFAQSHHLTTHLRVYTKEKPFKCDIMRESF